MRNNNLITSLVLLLWAITFTSCQKELITPTEIADQKKLESTKLTKSNAELKSDPNFVSSSAAQINLNVAACPTGTGFSVTVTSDDIDLTGNEYTINWYQNTEQTVLFEGQTLECYCQIGIRVEVYDLSGDLVAENSMDLGAC